MSSLSILLNAESVSSARVIRPTFAFRVFNSLLRSEGLPADALSSPCYPRPRANARQDLSIYRSWPDYLPLRTVFSPDGQSSKSLTISSVDWDLDILPIYSCRRCLRRRYQPFGSFGEGLSSRMRYYHRLGFCRQTTRGQGFHCCCVRLRLHWSWSYQYFCPRRGLSYYRHRYKPREGSLG